MATHSSVLAWKILWMAEPGGLPSMGSRRVGHDRKQLSSSSNLHSHQQCRKVLFVSTSSPAFVVYRVFSDGCSGW